MTPLRPLWRYLVRYSGWVTIAILATLTYAATTAAMIALIEPIFSEVLPFGDRGRLGGERAALPVPRRRRTADGGPRLAGISIFNLRGQLDAAYERLKDFFGITPESVVFFVPTLFFLVYMLRMIAAFLSGYAFQHAGLGVTSDLRTDLCDHMLHQSSRFHSEHSSGELFSRMVSDIDKMQSAVSNHLLDLLQQTTTLVVLLVLLLSTNFKLALICLVAAPAHRLPDLPLRARHAADQPPQPGAHGGALEPAHRDGARPPHRQGVRHGGASSCERFRRATDRHLRVNLRAQVLSSFSTPVVETVSSFGGCLLMIYAAYLIRAGQLTTPLLIQFFTNLLLLYDPIRRLNKVNLVLQGAAAAAQRVFQMLAIPNEIVDRPRAQPLETVKRGHRASSRCASATAATASPCSTTSPSRSRPARSIALVGPSGAGKSTVVNLLPRFFDPEAGSISIDGVDIRDLPLANLRSLIGLVTQETDPVQRHRAQQHRLRPQRGVARAGARGGGRVLRRRVHHGDAAGLRHRDRRVGPAALGRPAPAPRDRARAAQERADPDARRGHLAARHRVGGVGAEGARQPDAGPHHAGDRAPAVDRDVAPTRIVVMERGRIVERGTHAELLELGGLYKRLYDLQFRV